MFARWWPVARTALTQRAHSTSCLWCFPEGCIARRSPCLRAASGCQGCSGRLEAESRGSNVPDGSLNAELKDCSGSLCRWKYSSHL